MSTEESVRRVSNIPAEMSITEAYNKSVSVDPSESYPFFSLEYQWQDKPHRHVRDLCNMIDELKARLESLLKLVSVKNGDVK